MYNRAKKNQNITHPVIYCFLIILVFFYSLNSFSSPKIPNDHWDFVNELDDFQNLHELTIEKFKSIAIPVKASDFHPIWPVKDITPAVLTRFGTPTTLKFSGDFDANLIYLHEALDITRSSTRILDDVLAPVDGLAIIIREEGSNSDYSTSIAILDEKSGYVTSLLHVIPSMHLSDSSFTKVSRNEVIGQLAPVASMHDPVKQELYKHVHFSVIDIKSRILINPSNLFSHYQDNEKPTISDILIFDSKGNELTKLADDRIDLVVNAFDRDGINKINFEIAKLSIKVEDDKGRILHFIDSCKLDFLTSSVKQQKPFKDAFYLDFTGSYSNQDFIGFLTNASVIEREFSYAITNFKTESNSCLLLDDSDGFIDITSDVREITVEVEVFDHSSNRASFKKTIKR
jgi:hypothetical protein